MDIYGESNSETMKISLEGTAISAGVGALDIAMTELDARVLNRSAPFQNATDIARTALTLGSVALNYTNMETKFTDTVFYSSLPLFEKSVYRAALTFAGQTTSVRARVAVRPGAGPAARIPGTLY